MTDPVSHRLRALLPGCSLVVGVLLPAIAAWLMIPPASGQPLAVCTVTPAWGRQPLPTEIVPRFTQAAQNTLPTPRPAYTPVARGVPTQYPNGAGVTTRNVSVAEPIPSALLQAIGWVEGGKAWRQFDADYGLSGYTEVSNSCDYGLMQVNQASMAGMNPDLIAGNTSYNIGAGTRWLIGKQNWMTTPTPRLISPNNHTLADNWYYGVTAYHKWNWDNNPNNAGAPYYRDPQRAPFDGSQLFTAYPYQELVWGFMSHPGPYNGQRLWTPVRVPWVPRGIWGDFEETWRPAEWTSRPIFCSLPDLKANWSGWNSYIILQNTITYPHNYHLAADVGLYNGDGTFQKWWLPGSLPFHIPARGVTSLPVNYVFDPGQSFSGPSLTCASQDVGIVVQNVSSDQIYGYIGVALPGSVPDVGYSVAGPTAYLPHLCNNYQGWSTSFTVQNVGAEATDVSLTYYDANTGQAQWCASVHLEPNAAATIEQYTGGRVMNWPLGSGLIASNNGQPLAVTVKEQHGSGTTTAYNALTQGTSRVHLPLLMADYSGWYASSPLPTPTPVGPYRVYLPHWS